MIARIDVSPSKPKRLVRGRMYPTGHLLGFLAASIVLTLAIHYVPYGFAVGYPLVILSTIAHEGGHGIAGILAGGHLDSLDVYSDASGVAHVSGIASRVGRAFVAAGGLCGPAVAAYGLFALARSDKFARHALLGVGLLLAAFDVVFVRSLFGFVFVGLVSAIALVLARTGSVAVARLALVFVGVQLAVSVFSRGDYLFMKVAATGNGTMPSDVENMSAALFLPYWFWGALCGGFSVGMLALGARLLLPRKTATPGS